MRKHKPEKTHLRIVSAEEKEKQIERFNRQAEDYKFAWSPSGKPCLLLKHDSAIIENEDGSVTWFARVQTLNGHTFIELKTGEKKKTKTIYIPICLINPESHHVAEALLNTTIDPKDGRIGSKNAEIIALTPKGKGVVFNLDLKTLGVSYVTLQLFPREHVLKQKSKHCKFCQSTTK